MLPVISIIGRPNVGKSTLFNRVTRTRDALVDNTPGVTRDRLYGIARFGDQEVLVVDTGGIGEDEGSMSELISDQVESVLDESDAVLMLVDATQGLTVADSEIARRLHKLNCKIKIAVNKSEALDSSIANLDFLSLGFEDPIAISALRGYGIPDLFEAIVQDLPKFEDPLWQDPGPKVAVIGRPNVGKSTLVNSIVGESRLIVSETPGTTRDSVVVPLARGNKRYRFIDTAGVRRRSRVGEYLEKLSVVKSLQAIEAAHVAILVLDGSDSVSDQDATLAGLIRRSGRPVVIAVNKSDKIDNSNRANLRRTLERKLAFAPHHQAIYVSGLHRIGIPKLLRAVGKAYRSAMVEMPTATLNRCLRDAVTRTSPPMSKRRPVKLKYAHQGGRNPPVVVVHGNNVDMVADHYRRYLENYFREYFDLYGADVRVVFRKGANPFDKRK